MEIYLFDMYLSSQSVRPNDINKPNNEGSLSVNPKCQQHNPQNTHRLQHSCLIIFSINLIDEYQRLFFVGTDQPGSEIENSFTCSAKVKNRWTYTSTPPNVIKV
jgi:hypothetical protein